MQLIYPLEQNDFAQLFNSPYMLQFSNKFTNGYWVLSANKHVLDTNLSVKVLFRYCNVIEKVSMSFEGDSAGTFPMHYLHISLSSQLLKHDMCYNWLVVIKEYN